MSCSIEKEWRSSLVFHRLRTYIPGVLQHIRVGDKKLFTYTILNTHAIVGYYIKRSAVYKAHIRLGGLKPHVAGLCSFVIHTVLATIVITIKNKATAPLRFTFFQLAIDAWQLSLTVIAFTEPTRQVAALYNPFQFHFWTSQLAVMTCVKRFLGSVKGNVQSLESTYWSTQLIMNKWFLTLVKLFIVHLTSLLHIFAFKKIWMWSSTREKGSTKIIFWRRQDHLLLKVVRVQIVLIYIVYKYELFWDIPLIYVLVNVTCLLTTVL